MYQILDPKSMTWTWRIVDNLVIPIRLRTMLEGFGQSSGVIRTFTQTSKPSPSTLSYHYSVDPDLPWSTPNINGNSIIY